MTDRGYVMINRNKFESWHWKTNPDTCALFLCCLIKANHADGRVGGILIPRGGIMTSLQSLSNETGLTLQQVRTALEHLISTQDITKRSYSKNTVITIVSYDEWTCSNTVSNKQITNKQQTNNKRATNKQQTNNKRATTNNKNKKYIPPIREEYTAHAPERPDGGGLGAEKKKQIEVSVKEIRQLAKTVYGGDDYNACDFRRAFIESGTAFPENWKEVYEYFCQADTGKQDTFLRDMSAGKFHEKWGTAEYKR